MGLELYIIYKKANWLQKGWRNLSSAVMTKSEPPEVALAAQSDFSNQK